MSLKTFGQRNVYDKSKTRQLHSMVYLHHDKNYFRPKWYYWLFHNSYRKKDLRYIWQITPTIATSKLNKNSTEDEENEIDEDYKDELADGFDKILNVKYDMLYSDLFDELFLNLYSLKLDDDLGVLNDYSDNPFKQSEHRHIIGNFLERKKVIKDSYRPSHEKNTAYDLLIEDIRKYIGLVTKLKRILRVSNKYAPLLN